VVGRGVFEVEEVRAREPGVRDVPLVVGLGGGERVVLEAEAVVKGGGVEGL